MCVCQNDEPVERDVFFYSSWEPHLKVFQNCDNFFRNRLKMKALERVNKQIHNPSEIGISLFLFGFKLSNF